MKHKETYLFYLNGTGALFCQGSYSSIFKFDCSRVDKIDIYYLKFLKGSITYVPDRQKKILG